MCYTRLSLLGAPGAHPQRRPSWNCFLPLEALDSVRLWEPPVCRLAAACPETLFLPGGESGLSHVQEDVGIVRAPLIHSCSCPRLPSHWTRLCKGSEPHSRRLGRVALTAGQGLSSGQGPGREVGGHV